MLQVRKNIVLLVLLTRYVHGGILTGDLKLKSKPLTINSHHAPISININTDKLKASLPPFSLPKPAKPPPKILTDLLKPSLFSQSKLGYLNSKNTKLPKLPMFSESILPRSPFSKSLFPTKSIFPSKSILPSRKLSRSSILSPPALPSLSSSKLTAIPSLPSPKISPLTKLALPVIPPIIPIMPPVVPKIPLLPLIPPIPLIPIIPPILPPIIPIVPPLPLMSPLKPLRVPIIGNRSPLQKALGSELRPVVVDIKDEAKNVIMEKKLRNLLKRGSLTTAEFNRFRRLLLG